MLSLQTVWLELPPDLIDMQAATQLFHTPAFIFSKDWISQRFKVYRLPNCCFMPVYCKVFVYKGLPDIMTFAPYGLLNCLCVEDIYLKHSELISISKGVQET